MFILIRMNTRKTRHQFYLPDGLSAKLEAMAAKPGVSKTSILTEAFTSLLEGKASIALDEQFGSRLDRQDRTIARLEQKLDVIGEVLGLFIQHQLTLVAHQPPFAAETTALGRDRYLSLLETAGQKAVRRSTRGPFDGLKLSTKAIP